MIQDRCRCKHTFWHRICHITLLAVLPLMGYAQESRYRIMEYNVENLFDTIRSVLTDDIEFTPEGNHQWNTKRYWRKLSDISKTIASAGGKQPVDLVTLIEVENDGSADISGWYDGKKRLLISCILSSFASWNQ